MSYGQMGVDYELRVDFHRLRADRLAKSKKALKDSGLGALVCFDADNIRYVTSATIGEWARDKMQRYCILPKNEDPILFDIGARVASQLQPRGAPWLKGRVKPAVSWGRGTIPKVTGGAEKCAAIIKETLAEYGLEKEPIGFDLMDPIIMKALQEAGIQIEDGQTPMLEARLIKTDDEIELLDMSAMIVDNMYYELARNIRPGVTENELKGIAYKALYSMGADWVANVNSISGPRTNPHHHDATDRRLRPGDIIFFDVVNSFCGYCTCYYRTFCVGKPNEKQKEVYAQCLKWLMDSIEVVKPGVTTADIAKVWPGPEVLGFENENEAFANQFGHGIGMNNWELPVISRAFSLEYPYPIRENMVFALETYAGKKGEEFGVRLEDEIVVTSTGPRLLTKFPMDELMACPIL